MKAPTVIFLTASLLFISAVAVAQDAAARTVQYHAQDIVPIHAKLKYTTLIELPPTEKIMEAATGDKDFWSSMWSATSALCIRQRLASAPT